MEITIKSILLIGSTVVTGLSAGLFLAWTISVIPGTLRIDDTTYLNTMQSINRAILNPAFFFIFFGSGVLLSISSVQHFEPHSPSFWLLILAATCYIIGTIGITMLGNVPLNNQLDVLQLNEISSAQLDVFRTTFEAKWNQYHYLRTIFSVVSFVLATLAVFIERPNLNF